MFETEVNLYNRIFRIESYNTIIVGSGSAGLNVADHLYDYGQKDIAIVTEGLEKGTSRNTGADKQTYYKLTLSGGKSDSVFDMAKTLFDGGCMDGEIALVEAALSTQCFHKLVGIGVPFPHNKYGEFVGYKTDHDPRQRATSAGPLTAQIMTEKLYKQIKNKKIEVFDGFQVIAIFIDREDSSVIGCMALDLDNIKDHKKRYILFNCRNLVFATGGPAGIYKKSVYPKSQTGSTGIALEAGVFGKNLTESQYGIASIKFRWNLSGTYQQVLPRYISTEIDGSNEREFLADYFESPENMLNAIFLKGYQWPFDPKKALDYGSSLIDLLVYLETTVKGKRVWLDYTKNSHWNLKYNDEMDFSLLKNEAYNYLKNSNALFGKPIDRLKKMNMPAINLYKENGIDLNKEYLEIDVCAQHNNGGLFGNKWWESNIKHFFPIGEVNGTHGIYRPGGSALNSGQVGSTRAAEYIYHCYKEKPLEINSYIEKIKNQVKNKLDLESNFLNQKKGQYNVYTFIDKIALRMTKVGAHIRNLNDINQEITETKKQFSQIVNSLFIKEIEELSLAFKNYDLLLTQLVYLNAIKNYIEEGGKSRGSFLVYDQFGKLPLPKLPEIFRNSMCNESFKNKIQIVSYKDGNCVFNWEKVKAIPNDNQWFENVWFDFREKNIYT